MDKLYVDGIKDFYKGKKVFVTGVTGFKGSWLAYILTVMGAKVSGYSLTSSTDPSLYECIAKKMKVKTYISDIRDRESLRKAIENEEPDLVFHLAAQPIVRESYKNPVETFDTNVMGTVNVLECLRSCDSVKSIVNVTTDKVYKNDELEKPFSEEDSLGGHDPYSSSKACSEIVTESYFKSFLKERNVAVSTARAGNVIGGGDFSVDRIVPDAYRAAEAGEPLKVRNPYSVRPYQHVLEALFAYLIIGMEQYRDISKASNYNIGPDEDSFSTTGGISDLFKSFWNELDKRDSFSWANISDKGPHEAGCLKLDSAKMKKTFGWQPVWNIETAMKKTVEWYYSFYMGEDVTIMMEKQITEYMSCLKK